MAKKKTAPKKRRSIRLPSDVAAELSRAADRAEVTQNEYLVYLLRVSMKLDLGSES